MHASLSHEIVQPLHVETLGLKSPRVVELDDERNAVRFPLTSADYELSMEERRPLVNTGQASQLGSVHSGVVEKRTASSLLLMIVRQSSKTTGSSFGDEEVKDGA